MNRLKITFFKNCDLKTHKTVFLNIRQCDAFLNTHNFKMITCNFRGQTAILPNALLRF